MATIGWHSTLFAALAAAAALSATAASAQEPRVIRGYGADEDFQMRAQAAAGYQGVPAAAPAAYPQRPAAGRYGGGLLEFMMTGHDPTPPAGYRAAYRPNGAAVRYNEPSYRQAAYAPDQGMAAPVQRGLDPTYLRQEVEYNGPHRAGTIVVDTPNKFLYLVQSNGRAIRYGIGVGRPGFMWSGVKHVSRKSEWPDWTPPREMLLRRPDLPRHMEGGPANPLGARALYLGSSLYRIHGTNEPDTIGQNVSSGCIRMMNADVTDLYDRVGVGTKVIVM
ncbi:MAG: hypothetical protein NVSMB26_13340 [Beijerinckiaceae bacterium]